MTLHRITGSGCSIGKSETRKQLRKSARFSSGYEAKLARTRQWRNLSRSEIKLQSQLTVSRRICLRRYPAEVEGVVHIRCRSAEADTIEYVEHLEAELQIDRLREVSSLDDPDIL